MLNSILEQIRKNNINVYDIAIITDNGIESAYCQKCNACNESYSIAKLFISTAIGILVGKGLLSVNDKITNILSDELHFTYDNMWNNVTIYNALTHTIGIDYGIVDIDRDDINDYETNCFLDLIFSQKLKYEPGTKYFYSDVPHYILSRVITKITGFKADEFLLDKVLNPLGFRPVAWIRCPLGFTIGSTGLVARASDLVKLAWTYLNNGIYNSKEIVSSNWVKNSVDRGYEIMPIGDSGFLGKAGMNGQMMMYSPAHRVAVAWHSFEPTGRDKLIIDFCKELFI